MVISGGGIEWLILKYIYKLKCLLWISNVIYKVVCYEDQLQTGLKIPKGGNQNPYIEEQTKQKNQYNDQKN
jgi:hypothetical protein